MIRCNKKKKIINTSTAVVEYNKKLFQKLHLKKKSM